MAEIYSIPSSWIVLAEGDMSEAYEVDMAGIYLDDEGRFVFATASGCSCWSGEYDAEAYDTLDALAADADKERAWHYTEEGTLKLIADARAAIPAVLERLAASI